MKPQREGSLLAVVQEMFGHGRVASVLAETGEAQQTNLFNTTHKMSALEF